jgi:tRNA U55 pseudouridine synthase TruB
VGAHLAALRRTRTGDFGLDRALALDAAQADPQRAVDAMVPLAGMLPALPSVILTPEGVARVAHGQDIQPEDHQLSGLNAQLSTVGREPSRLRSLVGPASYGEARQSAEGATAAAISDQPFVRLLDASGDLLAIAEPTAAGLLHPSVVLV